MDLEALIAARPPRREDLGAWYSEILDAAERAGTRVPDLARRLGCSIETVYSWRRRLKRGPGVASQPASGLVRVEIAEPAHGHDDDRFEVRTRSGRSVLVPAGFDPRALAAVVAALEAC